MTSALGACRRSHVLACLRLELTNRTRLVMIGHIVLTGQINPVREIAELVHARGAELLVDGVLAIGHIETDVHAMGCDFYAAGFHKWGCGPRATAVFYVRPEHVETLPPLFGAYEEDENGRYVSLWKDSRMTKYETFGAHPDAHFALLGEAIDFLQYVGVARIRRRLFELTSRWTGARGSRRPLSIGPGSSRWDTSAAPGAVRSGPNRRPVGARAAGLALALCSCVILGFDWGRPASTGAVEAADACRGRHDLVNPW